MSSKYQLPNAPMSIRDANGTLVRAGDYVRVLGEPDLTGMKEPYRSETAAVFRHIVGARKRIHSFDQFGCAILMFGIVAGPHRGFHSVAIEPELIRKVAVRKRR